jgi:phospholipase A1/A2
VAPPATGAQPAVPGAECLSITEEEARLACFDRAVGDAARAAGDVGEPAGAPAGPGSPAATAAEAPPGSSAEAPGAAGTASPSLIESAWGFLPDSRPAYVRLHEPNYLLFARYTTDVNREPYEPFFEAAEDDYDFEDVEAKFQLSFKARLATTHDRRWGLWFAYTQQSQWQVYSGDISRPFRETNYKPELFASFRPAVKLGGLTFNVSTSAIPTSRTAVPIRSRAAGSGCSSKAVSSAATSPLIARAWKRFRPGDYEDDNPDITDFMGHGQVTALYRRGDNTFTLMGRGNLGTGKGAAQFTWTSRPVLGPHARPLPAFLGVRREPDRLRLEPDHRRPGRHAERPALRMIAGVTRSVSGPG